MFHDHTSTFNCPTQVIQIKHWNINGLTCEKIVKLQPFITNSNADIFILSETWLNPTIGYNIDIQGYKSFHFPRTSKHRRARRNSGGLLIYIRNYFSNHVEIIKSVKDHIWIKLKKAHASTAAIRDIYICAIYIPPIDSSSHLTSDPPWPELQDEIAHFHTLGDVVLIGDFNARTGDFQTNTHQTPNSRISKDIKVNSYGLELMSLCSAFDFKICNGSFAPDNVLGNCTCHIVNGSSCVDYAIVSQSLAQQTMAFQVDELETFSDHCPIALFLSLVKNSTSSHRSSCNLAQDLSNDIFARSMTPDSNQNPESHDNIKYIEENLCSFSEALKSTPPNFNYDNIMNSPDNPNNAQISIVSIVQ